MYIQKLNNYEIIKKTTIVVSINVITSKKTSKKNANNLIIGQFQFIIGENNNKTIKFEMNKIKKRKIPLSLSLLNIISSKLTFKINNVTYYYSEENTILVF